MEQGPDQIVACPYCGGLAKHMTLLSANNYNVRYWTDSKRVAPMWPSLPDVVQCRLCKDFYWLADARKIGTIGDDDWDDNSYEVNPDWAAAQEIEEPTAEGFYQALEKGLAKDKEQEKFLRILAWWRRNDDFRDGQCETIDMLSDSCKGNLNALASLLDESDKNDCIMKAEVLRELGEFELAKELLSRVGPNEQYAIIVRQLLSLCDAKDHRVRELEIGD